MKKNRQGIRFEGERRRRIFKRMGIAWGLMAFYSLVFGARLEDGSTSWAGIIVWGLLLLLVIGGFILGREDRNDKRMHQISKEVAEQYPKASDQELYNAYARFRGQEMRMEACLYLGIAAAFGIILLILRRMDAAPVSWLFGTRAALPALLVVSAALFIFSFTQMGINKAIPPLDRFASDPFLRGIYAERLEHPDLRYDGRIPLVETDGEPDCAFVRANYPETETLFRKGTPRALRVFGIIFFAVIPNLIFLPGIAMIFADDPILSAMGLFYLFLVVPTDCGLIWLSRHFRPYRWRKKQVKNGKVDFYEDTVLSAVVYEEKAFTLEVCFAGTGTILLSCPPKWFEAYGKKPAGRMYVMTSEGRALAAATAREEDGELPEQEAGETAEPPESVREVPEQPAEKMVLPVGVAAEPYNGSLDEEAIREEALRRIAVMDPAQRKKLDDDIIEEVKASHEFWGKVGHNLTKADWEKHSYYNSRDLHRRRTDYTTRAMEESVMENCQVTREGIREMKKNPYLRSLLITILIAVVVIAGATAGGWLIAQKTGANPDYLYVIISIISASFAMGCAARLLEALRFRKLKKKYDDPQFREGLVNDAVMDELRKQAREALEQDGAQES